jgi:hypothetical protein
MFCYIIYYVILIVLSKANSDTLLKILVFQLINLDFKSLNDSIIRKALMTKHFINN